MNDNLIVLTEQIVHKKQTVKRCAEPPSREQLNHYSLILFVVSDNVVLVKMVVFVLVVVEVKTIISGVLYKRVELLDEGYSKLIRNLV